MDSAIIAVFHAFTDMAYKPLRKRHGWCIGHFNGDGILNLALQHATPFRELSSTLGETVVNAETITRIKSKIK